MLYIILLYDELLIVSVPVDGFNCCCVAVVVVVVVVVVAVVVVVFSLVNWFTVNGLTDIYCYRKATSTKYFVFPSVRPL